MCSRAQAGWEFCLCTDFRKLNAITKTDSYPIPRIDDCIDRVGHSKYVSKLYLLKGFPWLRKLRKFQHSLFNIHNNEWTVPVPNHAFGHEECPCHLSEANQLITHWQLTWKSVKVTLKMWLSIVILGISMYSVWSSTGKTDTGSACSESPEEWVWTCTDGDSGTCDWSRMRDSSTT